MRECQRQANLAYKAKNRETHRAANREYARTHDRREYFRKWRKTPAGRAYELNKRLGRKTIDAQTVELVIEKSNGQCSYCSTEFTYDNYLTSTYATIDHIIPVSKNGTNDVDNLCLCCRRCNCSKGNKLLEEWSGPAKS